MLLYIWLDENDLPMHPHNNTPLTDATHHPALRSWVASANEPGTDGTVRAACANLQAEEVSLHFPGAGQPPIVRRAG